MSNKYTFEFSGTKEDFLNLLNASFNKPYSSFSGSFYYIDQYIIMLTDNEIHFGVERGGHSGGYWFIPQITELDDRTEFCGEIRYIGPENDRGRIGKVLDSVGGIILFLLLLPITMIIKLYTLINRVIRKICNRPQPILTTEERLFDLMENYLSCVRK